VFGEIVEPPRSAYYYVGSLEWVLQFSLVVLQGHSTEVAAISKLRLLEIAS
jgi:hypothetical protein